MLLKLLLLSLPSIKLKLCFSARGDLGWYCWRGMCAVKPPIWLIGDTSDFVAEYWMNSWSEVTSDCLWYDSISDASVVLFLFLPGAHSVKLF